MGLNVGELSATLDLDDKPFQQGMGRMNKGMGSLVGAAKTAGAAVAAYLGVKVGSEVLDAYVGFDNGMREVFTLMPGISGEAMDAMKGQVKDFSKEFGVVPEEVIPALYQSLSAGVPPDNVFEFLEVSQKAAKGGVTDLTTAVDGISSVVNAYGSDVLSATQASDLMFTAVKLGKTNFEELSQSLFNVTPISSSLGVQFGDVTAALAAMTAQGIPTSVATTQLRQMFVELSKEGTKTSDVFQEISGKSFKQFIAEGGNTQQALQMLEQYANDTGVGINDLFGSVEAGGAALALTGKGTETFTNAIDGMANSAGATEAAYGTMADGIGFYIDKAKAYAQVGMIEAAEGIGTAISWVSDSGAFDSIADGIRSAFDTITGVIDSFANNSVVQWVFKDIWDNLKSSGDSAGGILNQLGAAFQSLLPVLKIVATILGGVIVAAIWGLTKALQIQLWLWDNITMPIYRFVAFLIGNLAAAVTWIATHLTATWEAIKAAVGAAWDWITGKLSGAWEAIKAAVGAAVGFVTGIISGGWNTISSVTSSIWNGLTGIITGAWEGVKSAIQGGIDTIKGFFSDAINWLYDAGRAIIDGLVNGIKDAAGAAYDAVASVGGTIKDTVTSGFGILSPSRVMKGYGLNISEGLALGIAAGAGRVIDQAEALVNIPGLVKPNLMITGGGAAYAGGQPGAAAAAGGASDISLSVYFDESAGWLSDKIRIEINDIAKAAGRRASYTLTSRKVSGR